MRLGKAFVNFVNATLHISNLIFVRNQTNEVEPMAADETESDSRHQDFQGESDNTILINIFSIMTCILR